MPAHSCRGGVEYIKSAVRSASDAEDFAKFVGGPIQSAIKSNVEPEHHAKLIRRAGNFLAEVVLEIPADALLERVCFQWARRIVAKDAAGEVADDLVFVVDDHHRD